MHKHTVKLRIYDLSKGLAKTLGPSLGLQVDGIWHTAIEVYDYEYYFGTGVTLVDPGTTDYGHPNEIIVMGDTELQKVLFDSYLIGMEHKYNENSYDLFDNNCNHFTDDACQFLVGKPIPEYITDLPNTFINSPAYSFFEHSFNLKKKKE